MTRQSPMYYHIAQHTFQLVSDYMYVTNSYYEIRMILSGFPVGTGRLQDLGVSSFP